MKILHVITRSDLGGAQTVVISLANSMCEHHEIIVAGGENGPMWNVLDKRIKQVKIPQIVRPISPQKDISAFFELKKLYKQENPDVIHLHSSKVGILGRLALPAEKIVYSVHGFDSIRLAYRKFLPIEKALKNRCKAIVLASNYDKQNLINEGITKKLHVVHNGKAMPEITKDLAIKGAEKFKKMIMCIARISPQKRFDSFVSISKLLPHYAFVWIGADDKECEYSNNNLFVIKGFPNASNYLQICDLFVMPSNYEGVPIVIIDALSYGKPVVASHVGGISEIVINGYNGFALVNDDNLFAQKIEDILADNTTYSNYSNNSKRIFEQELTIEKMVNEYEKIYRL